MCLTNQQMRFIFVPGIWLEMAIEMFTESSSGNVEMIDNNSACVCVWLGALRYIVYDI